MAYVYFLKSEKGKFYIGSTLNLKQRIKHHEGGFTPSTKRLGKIALVFSQEYPTLKEARYIERRLKSLKRKDYIERIIRDGFIKMGQ
ncbi:GIY-YIG nuclease family protein [Candidatus Curtissbacteria bacterium]|nr:GIY-YIG nuclease family protein [Candidatus Curtissbacteria bacterium]